MIGVVVEDAAAARDVYAPAFSDPMFWKILGPVRNALRRWRRPRCKGPRTRSFGFGTGARNYCSVELLSNGLNCVGLQLVVLSGLGMTACNSLRTWGRNSCLPAFRRPITYRAHFVSRCYSSGGSTVKPIETEEFLQALERVLPYGQWASRDNIGQ